MDSVDAIILNTADDFPNQPEIEMTAKKKDTKPAADEGKAEKPAKAGKAAKAEKPAKAEKSKKELPAGFGPREIPEGFTGLNTIAEQVGRTPAACRRVLRAAEVAKPEGQHGWYWKDGSKDLKKIVELLTKEAAEE